MPSQNVIGTRDNQIQQQALKKSWILKTLRTEDMKMESAARIGAKSSGGAVNKTSRYLFSKLKRNKEKLDRSDSKIINCYLLVSKMFV